MNDILKLVENLSEAYVVGQKIIDHKVGAAKSYAIQESSKVISSIMSLMIVAGAFLGFLMFSFLLLGSWSATYWDLPSLTYATPALLSLMTTIIFWLSRKTIFRRVTQSVVRDVLD